MNLRKYKKMIFIIMIFSSIVFTFSIVSSILISDYKMSQELNYIENLNNRYITFTSIDDSKKGKIAISDVISILDKYSDSKVYIEYEPIPKYLTDTTLFGKGVYYNCDANNNFPILEGRNFTLDDITCKDKKILVGKNLKQQIVNKNNKDYFIIDREEFEVVGILGVEEKKSGYDDTFIINLRSTNEFLDTRAMLKLGVSNLTELEGILKEYKTFFENNNTYINITDENHRNPNLVDIFMKNADFANIFILVFAMGIMNLVIVMVYWMNKNIKEIGIRKAYGATNMQISLHILKQYELGIVFSVVIGTLMHFLSKPILSLIFPMYKFDLHYENIILSTLIFMLIGAIFVIIPLIKARKLQPVIIMKGSLK